MDTGTKIAIGVGALLLFSRQRSTAQAPRTSSPVSAAAAGLNSLEKSLLGLLSKPASSKSSGGAGGNPAGGAGSGRSAGGASVTSSVEDVFGTFDNLNSPNVIQQPAPVADIAPDLGGNFGFDPSGDTTLVNSLAAGSAGVPQFAGEIDPTTGLAVVPDSFSVPQDSPDFTDPTNSDGVPFV